MLAVQLEFAWPWKSLNHINGIVLSQETIKAMSIRMALATTHRELSVCQYCLKNQYESPHLNGTTTPEVSFITPILQTGS